MLNSIAVFAELWVNMCWWRQISGNLSRNHSAWNSLHLALLSDAYQRRIDQIINPCANMRWAKRPAKLSSTNPVEGW